MATAVMSVLREGAAAVATRASGALPTTGMVRLARPAPRGPEGTTVAAAVTPRVSAWDDNEDDD
jgi:hypothetical protein